MKHDSLCIKNKKYAAIFNHCPMLDQIFMYHYVIVQQVVKTSQGKQIVGHANIYIQKKTKHRKLFCILVQKASIFDVKKVMWWSFRQKNNCMSIFVSVL